MRYISAPHRSHGIAGSAAGFAARADFTGVIVRTTSCGGAPWSLGDGEPGMGRNYGMACQPKLKAK
jgi:hypothetical protein